MGKTYSYNINSGPFCSYGMDVFTYAQNALVVKATYLETLTKAKNRPSVDNFVVSNLSDYFKF